MTYEILSMNELDAVSGGDRKEYHEIANLLNQENQSLHI